MSTSVEVPTYASLVSAAMQSSEQVSKQSDELFRSRMAYANRVSEAVASRLLKDMVPFVKRACAFKNDDGSVRRSWAGCFISFLPSGSEAVVPEELPRYPVCFGNVLPDTNRDGSVTVYDDRVMVFANARGELFPQQKKPVGGFPVLSGDDIRIPLARVFLGYKSDECRTSDQTHADLAKRGVKSVLVRLHETLNASSPASVFCSFIGNGRFQVALAWDLPRFIAFQNSNAHRRAEKAGKEPRDWNFAIHLPAKGIGSTVRPRFDVPVLKRETTNSG